MLWTGGTFIHMYYIAHLHHLLVLFTAAARKVYKKKTLQFETIKQEISDKVYMSQGFCSI
jgi:hypothetical protein